MPTDAFRVGRWHLECGTDVAARIIDGELCAARAAVRRISPQTSNPATTIFSRGPESL
jgi:hypothetical protein